MFTDQERLQRKREMARLRQARKRARDRERQSLGRDSLGSGMELDPADIAEGRSESGDHSTLNQGTDDELDEDELVGKGPEMMGLGQSSRQRESGAGESPMISRGESRGRGIEVTPQPLVVSGIGPMQLHPDGMQGTATGTGVPTPNLINMHPEERISVYDHPRTPEDIVAEDDDVDEEGDNHAIIWPWLRRTARLIESSRGDRKMQEEIYTVLYTEEMARMLYDWESTRPERSQHQQSELKDGGLTESGLGARSSLTPMPVAPLSFHGQDDGGFADEAVDELLGHLEERVQAIKKQKGLKAEVQSLKRDLVDKEKQLKEYNAIVDTERAAWQAERAEILR